MILNSFNYRKNLKMLKKKKKLKVREKFKKSQIKNWKKILSKNQMMLLNKT